MGVVLAALDQLERAAGMCVYMYSFPHLKYDVH